MMKRFIWGLVSGAFVCVCDVSGVHAAEDKLDAMVTTCALASDEAWCKAQVEQFRENWPDANKGSYQAQRNVAFCLGTTCDGAVVPDLVAACAWRIVIMGSDADIDSGDAANYRHDCKEKANSRMRGDAQLMAARLFKKIYKRKLEWADQQ